MKICVYLSYVGLGTNLLHLSYCHEISKKYGPISIITLCKNLKFALEDDPKIKEVIVLENKYKKLVDIFYLSTNLKKYKFDKIFIYYPSLRIYLAAKFAGIKNIYHYSFFNKKNLHLIDAAKEFTCKSLKIKDCQTKANFFLSENKKQKATKYFNAQNYNIVIGAGSSGPTTKWGTNNFSNLINKLNKTGNYFFFILCGLNEENIYKEILERIEKKNCIDLSQKNISEVIPFLCLCDMYVGNDSFGSHITSQSDKHSLVILLDSPRAYTDYTKFHHRIIPDNMDLNDITHGSLINPNSISVDKVYNQIIKYKN